MLLSSALNIFSLFFHIHPSKTSGRKDKNGEYNSLPDEERGTKRSSFGRGLCADPAKGLRTLKAVFVPTSKENTPDNGKVTSTFFHYFTQQFKRNMS